MAQPLAFQAHLAALRRRGWEVVSELDDPPYARLRRPDPAIPARSHHCELWLDDDGRIRTSGLTAAAPRYDRPRPAVVLFPQG